MNDRFEAWDCTVMDTETSTPVCEARDESWASLITDALNNDTELEIFG